MGLTPEEEKTLIGLLNKVNPSMLGPELFEALARVTINVAIETVALQTDPSNQREVFLIKRPFTELAYPGDWHSPGSSLRPGESFEDVFKRLQEKEFCADFQAQPEFAAIWNNPREPRGHYLHIIYLVKVESPRGLWFPVNQLPEPIIVCHREAIIPIATERFNLLHRFS